MNEEKYGKHFWLGNVVMAIALLILLFMGRLWEQIGVAAMGLWVVVAGIGAWLMLKDGGRR